MTGVPFEGHFEPTSEQRDLIEKACGEEYDYDIAFSTGEPIRGTLHLYKPGSPQRARSYEFPTNATRDQVIAVWAEMVDHTVKLVTFEREQEAAKARGFAPDPSPANEVKPGEALPRKHECEGCE